MKQDLNISQEQVHFGDDSIVIIKHIADIPGGRTLDVTDFTDTVIKAGHVIITDGKGAYKPMPVSEGKYGTLPENFHYAGVLYRTILKSKPAASIMDWGKVNEEAAPYKMDTIKEAFVKEVPHIEFTKDEEA